MSDDEKRRAELVKRGIAITGVGRAGAMRAGVDLNVVISRVLDELAELRTELAELRAELRMRDDFRSSEQAATKLRLDQHDVDLLRLTSARRRGGQITARKHQTKLQAFVQRVDNEIKKNCNFDQAIEHVLRRQGGITRSQRGRLRIVKWSEMTPVQRKKAKNQAKQRYRREKRHQKNHRRELSA